MHPCGSPSVLESAGLGMKGATKKRVYQNFGSSIHVFYIRPLIAFADNNPDNVCHPSRPAAP